MVLAHGGTVSDGALGPVVVLAHDDEDRAKADEELVQDMLVGDHDPS